MVSETGFPANGHNLNPSAEGLLGSGSMPLSYWKLAGTLEGAASAVSLPLSY